jgi:hypothetical protein
MTKPATEHLISEVANAIEGQMLKIRRAIEEELAAGAPLRELKTGEIWDRLQARMRDMRMRAKEVPSRSACQLQYNRQHGNVIRLQPSGRGRL